MRNDDVALTQFAWKRRVLLSHVNQKRPAERYANDAAPFFAIGSWHLHEDLLTFGEQIRDRRVCCDPSSAPAPATAPPAGCVFLAPSRGEALAAVGSGLACISGLYRYFSGCRRLHLLFSSSESRRLFRSGAAAPAASTRSQNNERATTNHARVGASKVFRTVALRALRREHLPPRF